MLDNTKCECGHQNPLAALLCEACGKPLQNRDECDATVPEMRYDGAARRSLKNNPGLIDRVWSFFSSVKVAVYLIVITLIASTLGTIYPQENTFINLDPSTYYKETYGSFGHVYYLLGLSHTYGSWWYIGLLFMIGASLVVCSLDRVLPLYRALSKQQVTKATSFILRQKVSYHGPLPSEGSVHANGPTWISQTGALLRNKGYRVRTGPDGTALLAEKHRFSRWGPYINHIGLILFLGAVLMRNIPGWHMDQYLAFPEGKPVKIPETPYYLLNEKFTVEFYEDHPSVPKLYETKAVLYTCESSCDDPTAEPVFKEVHRQDIAVNKPMSYQGLLAYQFDYKQKPMLLSVKPVLKNKQTGEVYGSFDLSMFRPQASYEAGAYKLELKGYFPDFDMDESGRPVTKSKDPNTPAFIFLIRGPGLPQDGEVYMYFPKQTDKEQFRQDELNGPVADQLELTAGSMENVKISLFTSYLNIRMDKALSFLWAGAAVSMTGLVMGFYWQHRRIWLRVDGGMLSLGAHTNKNRFGLRKEIGDVLGKAGIPVDPQKLETGGIKT